MKISAKIVCGVFLIAFVCLPISLFAADGADWAGGDKVWAMDYDLSTADASFLGEETSDIAGTSISSAGDLNGDGYDDFVISSDLNDGGGIDAGKVYIFFGSDTPDWTMGVDLSAADVSFTNESIGVNVGDNAGIAVAGGGDLNGDGYDDIIVGSAENSDIATDAGKVYIIFGKEGGWVSGGLSAAGASFRGENESDRMGVAVSIAGDVNGDGFDDILIGASGYSVGAFGRGKVYLVFGMSSGWQKNVDIPDIVGASFLGEVAGNAVGTAIAGVGNVNGDGYDDILIGADGSGDAGKAYLIFGKAAGWATGTNLGVSDVIFTGETVGDGAGIAVSGAGDVNGDGFKDMLIGAGNAASVAGKTYLIFGKAGWSAEINLSSADVSFIGEITGDFTGFSLSALGDINVDGFGDFIIGAPGNDEAENKAGQAYIVLGKSSGWSLGTVLSSADASFWGEAEGTTILGVAGDWAGYAVSGAGDVNGDGYYDILISAPFNDGGATDSGQVYLILSPSPDDDSNVEEESGDGVNDGDGITGEDDTGTEGGYAMGGGGHCLQLASGPFDLLGLGLIFVPFGIILVVRRKKKNF